MGRIGVIGIAVALAGAGVLVTPAPQHGTAAPDTSWRPCFHGVLQCRTVEAPVDYRRPDGATWTIPVSRYPAAVQPAPRGAILLNDGGPGIPGLASPADPQGWAPLHAEYDIIGFDPRGVGSSQPAIECLRWRQQEAVRGQVSAPVTPSQRRLARRLGRMQGNSCLERYRRFLPHVGTADVARDMDLIRQSLGLDRISYLGFSYGTFLGATYAELFPGRTDRVVLDSAMDPALDYPHLRRDQAREQNVMVRRFLRDCIGRSRCPYESRRDGRHEMSALIDRLDRQPFRRGKRTLSGSRATGLIESANYSPRTLWPGLRRVLRAAHRGDLRPMLRSAYSDALMVNPADSQYLAVMCIDFQTTRQVRRPQRLAPRWEEQAPFSGANRAWSLQPCETWPAPSDRTPKAITATGSGKILVVANRHDPATPITWGRAMARHLTHGRLVEVSAQGHISWSSSHCARRVMIRFLHTGVRPPPGTVCR